MSSQPSVPLPATVQYKVVYYKMSSKANYKVYMDVQIGASGAGRIIFELFNDLTSKTCENFRGLCTGEYGKANNMKLHYLNTKFHKIIDGFVIQGGDISNSGGKGGYSIYGRTFLDESFARTHSCAGLLSMANCGRNTNSSQFLITLKPCPHLDGKHVVFGQVIDGMEVVKKISKVPIDKEDKPRYPIIIVDCGEIDDFRGFLRYDPFKKEVFQEIREARERIIKDQHSIRKLLSEGLDPNEAYNYKKRLEACEKNLAELDRREQQIQFEQQEEKDQIKKKPQDTVEQKSVETVAMDKLRDKLGQERVDRLLEINLKLNEAQVAISKAALEEQIRENDVNYHKMLKKQQWLKKKKEGEEEVMAKGLSTDKLYLNRNALKKEEEEKVDQNFGWNVYGEEAYYKAYHKRCQTLEKDEKLYKDAVNGQPIKPSEDALTKLQQDVIKQQQKRSTFSRRRMYDEDETVTYINERNRIYNQKLERNFGVFASSTKTALEMNSLK